MFKLSKQKLFAIASGASLGSLALWYSNKPITASGSPYDFPVTKSVQFSNIPVDFDITLYQYQTCPFCCKVRTYLNYHGINHNIVEVNSLTQKQLKWSEYRKVPIALVKQNDETFQINDSSVIISLLESYRLSSDSTLNKIKKYYPEVPFLDKKGKTKVDFINKYQIMLGKQSENPEKAKSEIHWRIWVDDTFVHTLSPNIYRTPSEAIDTFNYVAVHADWVKNFGFIQTKCIIYLGAFTMFFVGKILKKRHNLKDDVRQSLFEQSDIWVEALGKDKFMGGLQPNLSDLAMLGVLTSIEGCTAFKELMHHNSKLKSWFKNVRDLIDSKHTKLSVDGMS